jgi:hypothetical protein
MEIQCPPAWRTGHQWADWGSGPGCKRWSGFLLLLRGGGTVRVRVSSLWMNLRVAGGVRGQTSSFRDPSILETSSATLLFPKYITQSKSQLAVSVSEQGPSTLLVAQVYPHPTGPPQTHSRYPIMLPWHVPISLFCSDLWVRAYKPNMATMEISSNM